LSSDNQHRGEPDGRGEKTSASSKSARIRKPPAVAAFGAQGELALKLRALGDELDDVVTGLRNRDALAVGSARKLIASWRAIGEPILWYPTEIRSAGKLVLAAELERACFVLPAYQAGLRALMPTEHMTGEDVLALAEQLLRLEAGELTHETFFMWLWSGNPSGLTVLLGHPLTAMPGMVLEQPIPPDEIWQSHTAAAMEEWNQLAWSAAQAMPLSTLEARYRAPALGLSQRVAQGELGLSQQEADALRDSCDGGPDAVNAQLALLAELPELAALLPPNEAAALVRAAISTRLKLPMLLQCIGMMSEPAAAAAIAAEPRLMQHAPRLCHELLAGKTVRSSLLMRALLSHSAAGMRGLCRALGTGELRELEGDLISIVLGACVDLGHGTELLLPLWSKRDAPANARALALQAIGRDSTLFNQAITTTPLTSNDPPELQSLAAALRGSLP
jgi:hypothetical protein